MKRNTLLLFGLSLIIAACSSVRSQIAAPLTTTQTDVKTRTRTADLALITTIVARKTATYWAELTFDIVLQTTVVAMKTREIHTTPMLTPAPSQTQTPTITPTPRPELRWSKDVSRAAEIDIVGAIWSSIAPEFVGYVCPFPSTSSEGVYLASAPDFHARRLNPPEFGCTSEWGTAALSWSPNGESIAWSGVGPAGETPWNTTIWITDRSGKQVHALDVNERDLRLPGWMDDYTLVYVGYGGGGTWRSGFVDIRTNTVYALDRTSSNVYPPAHDLIPFQVLSPDPTFFNQTRVVLRELVETGFVEWDPSDLYPYSKEIPTSGEFSEQANSRFADWFPDGKRMLILVWEYDTDTEDKDTVTAFEVWETEQDSTYLLVPGGVYGRVSPDGRLLAFLTRHPLQFDGNQRPLSEVISEDFSMFYVMEIGTNKVVLSLPTDPRQISAGMLEEWGGDRPNLISWAPDSNHLVYRNDEGNLTIVDIASGHLTPITKTGGEFLTDPNWSFNGSYLSVTLREFNERLKYYEKTRTFILDMP